MSPELNFDHIAVVARDLETGAAYVRAKLGIEVPEGGRHDQMGTHNRLMRLGGDEFLEIIAVDPAAPKPAHPRWFGLDEAQGNEARLGNWIVRTDDMAACLKAFPPSIGLPTRLTRGALEWLIAVPDDGSLPFGGAFPTIIEWPSQPFPGSNMADFGCSLEQLVISHPNARIIEERLKGALQDRRIIFESAPGFALTAAVRTPSGLRML